MKKIIICSVLIFILLFPAMPLEVDQSEIRTGKTIEFINFTGDQTRYSAEIIKGIGILLSRELKRRGTVANYYGRYSVIHAVDPSTDKGYDGDIFSVLELAKVNHIDSLRLVLAGYLEAQYGYSQKDARTLATFITIYNAVYRGDTKYFTSKYKAVVMKNITASKVGLSTHYKDWPGGTQILIPLTGEAGYKDLSSVDTTPISDEKVVETLREKEDKGLEERKDLVELKEETLKEDKKELVEDKKEVEETKKDIVEEKKEVKELKEELKEDKKEIDKKEQELKEDKKELTTIKDPEEKAKKEEEIKAKEEELKAAKEEVEKKEDVIKEKEDTIETKTDIVEKKEEDIKEKEAAIEKKEEEIVEDKKEIEKDEKILEILEDPEKFAEELYQKEEDLKVQEENLKKQETDEKTFAGKFYYLKMEKYMSGGHYNNVLYILNANTGKVLVKSPEANISGRKYDIVTEGVVVVINKGAGNEYNYLALLDLDTLERKSISDDAVFHRSFVEVRDKQIYIITHISPNYYLGKYDMNLKRLALSKEPIAADSFITFYGDRIYINSADNDILALKRDDLSLIETIIPE